MTEDGLFDVAIWGTVGQWVGVVATFAVAALSLYFAQAGKRQEAKSEAEKHVRMLILGVDEHWRESADDVAGYADLRLLNAGVSPVRQISVSLSAFNTATGEVDEVPWKMALLRTGEEAENRIPEFMMWDTDYTIVCTDINDVTWIKKRDGSIVRRNSGPRRKWSLSRRG